jgi:hypothetical protein
MIRTCLFVLLSAMTGLACATSDRIAEWHELTVRAVVHGEKVTVTARASTDRLLSLATESRGSLIEVPVPELSGVPSPHLHTIQILYGAFHASPALSGAKAEPASQSEKPYYFVKLTFGKPKIFERKPYFDEVSFLVWDGRYQERSVRWVIGKDQWRYETKKAGRAPEAAGTEKVLDSAPK